MKPLTPVSPGAKVALGVAFFVVFFAVWSIATFGGYVQKTFLADPVSMFRSGWTCWSSTASAVDIGMTVWRVVGGFVLAAHGAAARRGDGRVQAGGGVLRALRQLRALPAGVGLHSAADPVGGHRRGAEAGVIFIGSFFQLVLMISVVVGNTRRDLVEAAYTLGSSDASLVRRVLVPGAAPEIAEILRTVLGWAWTYVIVAELIGAPAASAT
jgi:NitT/TauT family transport system permease protein